MKKIVSLLIFLSSFLFSVSTENILALTWENSFCKVYPKNKGCKFRDNFDRNYFLLHGLWPKKKNYCGYKPFKISYQLKKVLEKYLPTIDLAKHEWKKHGSCFGSNAETYFLTAIKLTQQFNESEFLTFVRTHMGEWISLARIRFAFAGAFGNKNRRKFQLICKRKNGKVYITEIRISLKGDPIKKDLDELINNANEMIGVKQCQGGIFARF